jgi:GT2 family glycosyltransferase
MPPPGTGERPTLPPNHARPAVSVLIVSYNTKEMTLACLRSLREETRAPHEVIVVDNASSDGSAEAIARDFPEVRLVRSRRNVGFAAATNLAAAAADGRFLLLLNPDTLVLDSAVDRLLAFAGRRPSARIWGGRTLFADGTLNAGSCWQRMTLWNTFCRTAGLTGVFPHSALFNPEGYGGWARDSERPVDIVTGCLLLIERSFWERLGGFDPAFFMFGEEADLCLRARRLGASPRVTHEATIVHHGTASLPDRADALALILRAKVELASRHLPRWQRPLALGLLRLWPLSRLVALRLAGRVAATASAGTSVATWGEVWRRRESWWSGY